MKNTNNLRLEIDQLGSRGRLGRDQGTAGLVERKRGRKPQGSLACFSLEAREVRLKLKQAHNRWGANRVLIELGSDPFTTTSSLPEPVTVMVHIRWKSILPCSNRIALLWRSKKHWYLSYNAFLTTWRPLPLIAK